MVCRAPATFFPREDPAMQAGKRMSARCTWLSEKLCDLCLKNHYCPRVLGSNPNSSMLSGIVCLPACSSTPPPMTMVLVFPLGQRLRAESMGCFGFLSPSAAPPASCQPLSIVFALAYLHVQRNPHPSVLICPENLLLPQIKAGGILESTEESHLSYNH